MHLAQYALNDGLLRGHGTSMGLDAKDYELRLFSYLFCRGFSKVNRIRKQLFQQ